MENKNNQANQNQNNFSLSEIYKKHIFLFLFIILAIILIILLIFYLIEKIIFIILTTITFTKLISIPLQIFLHLLFIRYIILEIAFVGQNFILMRSILYNLGINQASQINKSLHSLHNSLSVFNDIRALIISKKELSEIKKNFGNIQAIISYFLDIFRRMKNKFNKLSIDQEIFYNNLQALNDSINNGNIINFINNTIDIIKKYNKDSLADIPDEEKNKILAQISRPNLNIQKILVICHTLMEQIDDYIGERYNCLNARYIRNYFQNNLFASIEQLHCELSNFYNFEEKYLITKDNCKLEYIIIKNNNNLDLSKKKLMIICGPNGVPYQIFSRNLRFQQYLDSNIDVLCWNYRGYGLSKGKPSYNKLRSDVLELFDEVIKYNNYDKFAVHGISIGGIPCCHLASNRKEIELLICDRNFGRLDNITQSFPCGKYLFFIYKLFLFQSTNNVDNYLKAKCYKIILNDPKDTIVLETCSLKTLISQKLCENYFDCIPEKNSFENNNIIGNRTFSNHNNELESLSSKNNFSNSQNTQLTSLNDTISSNYNSKKFDSKILIKKTALDKIFNSVEEKNKFVNLLINISKIINNDKLDVKSNENCFKKIIKKLKSKAAQYSNLKEEELQNTSGIFDFVKNHLVDIFDSIESAGDTLFTLLMIKRDYTKAVFIDNFFNNMFIWGSKYHQTGEKNNLHSTRNIRFILEECMKLFEEFWNSQEIVTYKGLTLIKDIENLYKYFIHIQNNLKYVGLNSKEGFVKLINDKLINDNNYNDYEKCLSKYNIGNFVPLSCGHNGALSSEESELFDMYINKSSFFNEKIEENVNKIYEDKEDHSGSDGSDSNLNI